MENISPSDITTSHIERQNLTFRQENERLARKTIGFSKEDYWLNKHMIYYKSFFNFVRPHSGLKLKINQVDEDITNRKYIKRTPMMAAGKTDHICIRFKSKGNWHYFKSKSNTTSRLGIHFKSVGNITE